VFFHTMPFVAETLKLFGPAFLFFVPSGPEACGIPFFAFRWPAAFAPFPSSGQRTMVRRWSLGPTSTFSLYDLMFLPTPSEPYPRGSWDAKAHPVPFRFFSVLVHIRQDGKLSPAFPWKGVLLAAHQVLAASSWIGDMPRPPFP